MSPVTEEGLSVTHPTHRTDPPHLRLIHYNDVYHVEEGSAEPVGGVARFQSVINHYRSDPCYSGQPDLLTFFSGDAYNPSLQSTVTKGKHMVPFLNKVGTDVACVGNHDLDFGVAQFRHLRDQCRFPWLLANVLDPALGEDVPIADCGKTMMLTASNGVKVGVVGLGEREWLGTINALPPDLIYKSASKTAMELVPRLREQGAELIVAVTHQREPNDYKLAENLPPGLVDIIMGGHDHFYAHTVVNGVHVLRSGTDFKQLSYIEAWKKEDGPGWDFSIIRRDIVRLIPEDPATMTMVGRLTSSLQAKLEKPIGFTTRALDGRFSTVRQRESNLGNFACDLMRFYYGADCAMMAGGTIRGDQIYPPGILRLKDILNCFPFEDPVVLIRLDGKALIDALENGVSQLPAMEGRFPQVSNIAFSYNPSAPSGSRINWAKVDGAPIDYNRKYTLATRGYMARGKDGFSSLLIESEGGQVEEIVDEESGILISTLLRQYFLSLRVLGKWRRWSPSMTRHWTTVHENLHSKGWLKGPSAPGSPVTEKTPHHKRPSLPPRSKQYYYGRFPELDTEEKDGGLDREQESMDSDSDTDPDILTSPHPITNYVTLPARSATEEERRLRLARKVTRTWMRRAGLQPSAINDTDEIGEFTPSWTPGIAPRLEGRIVIEST
ncbi:Metallo-dependent phosphatase [Aspergillus heteromorphus CBS 117.55]|uniref:Metallo-dependent phosphatase n=1 Tax=Aspergillus heteromorphus CBS 117.55 TaxID=1448321 RepID=A0A317WTH7_9EURO|nr:Metallo-dependent phosphatase [Aspergillus heteromorphus CBS 117.55]PWY88238.1 Metallo-dependent phosphatase [Aspergillus heteromorphus CBS 117.55]